MVERRRWLKKEEADVEGAVQEFSLGPRGCRGPGGSLMWTTSKTEQRQKHKRNRRKNRRKQIWRFG